jgi:hypothetical protein
MYTYLFLFDFQPKVHICNLNHVGPLRFWRSFLWTLRKNTWSFIKHTSSKQAKYWLTVSVQWRTVHGAMLFCRSSHYRLSKCRHPNWRLENVGRLHQLTIPMYVCILTWPNQILLGCRHTPAEGKLPLWGAVRRGQISSPFSVFFYILAFGNSRFEIITRHPVGSSELY